jgi:hypothetical protein
MGLQNMEQTEIHLRLERLLVIAFKHQQLAEAEGRSYKRTRAAGIIIGEVSPSVIQASKDHLHLSR